MKAFWLMFAVLASGALSGCAMLSSGDPDISGTGFLVGGAGLLFGIAVNASKSSTGIIFFGPKQLQSGMVWGLVLMLLG